MFLFNLILAIFLSFFQINVISSTNHSTVNSSTRQLSQLPETVIKKPMPNIEQLIQERKVNFASPQPISSPSIIPSPVVLPTPKPTPMPTPLPKPSTPVSNIVSVDSNLNSQSLFNALNNYRIKKGLHALSWDSNLGNYAQQRANHFQQIGDMDNHAQFKQLTSSEAGFRQLGFRRLGENSSSGFSGNPVELIENIYAGSSKHEENQLNPAWTSVGTGVSGGFTDLVFGGNEI